MFVAAQVAGIPALRGSIEFNLVGRPIHALVIDSTSEHPTINARLDITCHATKYSPKAVRLKAHVLFLFPNSSITATTELDVPTGAYSAQAMCVELYERALSMISAELA
jgi:hypothetical protein